MPAGEVSHPVVFVTMKYRGRRPLKLGDALTVKDGQGTRQYCTVYGQIIHYDKMFIKQCTIDAALQLDITEHLSPQPG